MCPSYTTHYNIPKPLVNDPTDQDLWGTELNSGMDIIDSAIYAVQQSIYPIGSVYLNYSDSTNPATLLGFGTWVSLAGQTLIGVGTYTDGNGTVKTYTAGQQVGEYNHTLITAEMPSHTHALTDPGHLHTATTGGGGGGPNGVVGNAGGPVGTLTTNSATTGITIDSTGGGGAHNNVQPSIAVYMWRRTA